MRNLLLAILPLFLIGCASTSPLESIEHNTPIEEVLQNSESHQGEEVRWGGTIASVKNKQGETWIEIVSRDLKSNGRPKRGDTSGGRFIAKVVGFLEPEIYKKGRMVTVQGEVSGSEAGFIGTHAYTFPVVKSTKAHLWPAQQANLRPIDFGWSLYGSRWGVHSRQAWPFFRPRHPYYW